VVGTFDEDQKVSHVGLPAQRCGEKLVILGCFIECASLVMVVIVRMGHEDSAYIHCSSRDIFIYQRMHTVVEIKPEARLLSEMSCGRVNRSVADWETFSDPTRETHLVRYDEIHQITRHTGVGHFSR
jgi:hypothetical protein